MLCISRLCSRYLGPRTKDAWLYFKVIVMNTKLISCELIPTISLSVDSYLSMPICCSMKIQANSKVVVLGSAGAVVSHPFSLTGFSVIFVHIMPWFVLSWCEMCKQAMCAIYCPLSCVTNYYKCILMPLYYICLLPFTFSRAKPLLSSIVFCYTF